MTLPGKQLRGVDWTGAGKPLKRKAPSEERAG